MTAVGGTVISVEGNNACRRVDYTGTVNHTRFENKLIEIANGNRNSWNFIWADAITTGLASLAELSNPDYYQYEQGLKILLAATEKVVTIKIAREDRRTLKDNNYSICFAKRVGNNDYNVVWQSSDGYLETNTFRWTPQYQLFGTNTFTSGLIVDVATNRVNISLGETSILDKYGDLLPSTTRGPSTAITMDNQYGLIHPGINQLATNIDGSQSNTPIYVAANAVLKGTIELTPIEKILVWFEQNVKTGTMFSTARTNSIEIDLTTENTATWLFSSNKWSKV
ncbi:hypothetical conserved protein [Candidatus Nitrosoglobus terrae]|uniref:Hypothetical conserved protein n=1 Tax=Candidatus Nitrosoglobus terrae TaxID=1630141 RepID=A0A1Q2SPA1_9GAMM|nr:hypothetical protein [Candidatus Nitrosoglobus terrae]BAW80952.1 hypothetical conserved protein [Candidatus Nitrosoglobus terrae]